MPDKTENFQFPYNEVFNSDPPCDRTKSLFEYFQDVLPQQNRPEFDRHLSSCEACLKLLADLQESQTIGQAIALDAAHANKIYDEGRQRFGKERITAVHPATIPTFRLSSIMNVLTLMLVVILAYPAYRSFILQREVQELQSELNSERAKPVPENTSQKPAPPEIRPVVEPVASPALIYAVRMERDSEKRLIRLAFDQATATLILSVPTESFESYKVELLRKSEPIWESQISSTRNEISQIISIHLQKAYLQEGEYLLRITGQQAGGQRSFPEYRIIVTHPRGNEKAP